MYGTLIYQIEPNFYHPKSATELIEEAETLLKSGQDRGAILKFKKIMELFPSCKDRMKKRLAQVFFDQGVHILNNKNRKGHDFFTLAIPLSERIEIAERCFVKAIEYGRTKADIYDALIATEGEVSKKGDTVGAKACFQAAKKYK